MDEHIVDPSDPIVKLRQWARDHGEYRYSGAAYHLTVPEGCPPRIIGQDAIDVDDARIDALDTWRGWHMVRTETPPPARFDLVGCSELGYGTHAGHRMWFFAVTADTSGTNPDALLVGALNAADKALEAGR
jgi:hypothetical protein